MKLVPIAAAAVSTLALAACGDGGDGTATASAERAAADEVRAYRANLRGSMHRFDLRMPAVAEDDSIATIDRKLERSKDVCDMTLMEMDNLQPPARLAGDHDRLRSAIARLCREAAALANVLRPGALTRRRERAMAEHAERLAAAQKDALAVLKEVAGPLGLQRRVP